jgi:hypothetical protein
MQNIDNYSWDAHNCLVKQNIVSGLTFKNVFNFKRDKMKY